jgi:hypothetical protein
MADATAALAGADSMSRARDRLKGDKANDPRLRLAYARALMQRGRKQEALNELVWCFDHGLKHAPDFNELRESVVVEEIGRLAESLPQAGQALTDRRDRAESALTSGRATPILANDLATLNWQLNDNARTLKIYDQLSDADCRAAMFDYVLDPLLEARRHDDALAGIGEPAPRIRAAIDRHLQLVEQLNIAPDDADGQLLIRKMREELTRLGGRYYETLLGAKRADAAAAMAESLIAFEPTGRTYAMLMIHAIRTGHRDRAEAFRDRAIRDLPPGQHAIIHRAQSMTK